MKRAWALLIGGLLLFSLVQNSQAATIDFELLPNGDIPTEGTVISDQFEAAYGITFSLTNGGSPVLVGGSTVLTGGAAGLGSYRALGSGFFGPGLFSPDTNPDTPAHNQPVGTFFLTDDLQLGLSSDLVITYTNPVSAASGVILDIDNSEEWTITAYDSANNVVGVVILSFDQSDTGDGIATAWSFDHGDMNDIAKIVFHGERTDPGNYPSELFGLAFDSFSSSSPIVPAPASFLLLLSGLIGLLRFTRRPNARDTKRRLLTSCTRR